MQRLLRLGEIYLNPIRNYRSVKTPEVGDTYEGAFYLENLQIKSIGIDHPSLGKHEFKIVPESKSRLTEYDDTPHVNYSMFGISCRTFDNCNDYSIPENVSNFGDTCIMIRNPLAFLESIVSELKSLNLPYQAGFVNYIDFSSQEKINLSYFDKNTNYKHQEEFRVVAQTKNNCPLVLQIGSIESYSLICSTQSMVETQWQTKRKREIPPE